MHITEAEGPETGNTGSYLAHCSNGTPSSGHWKGRRSEGGRKQGKLLLGNIRTKHLLREHRATDHDDSSVRFAVL